MKHFDVPLDHAWKVPVLQELLKIQERERVLSGRTGTEGNICYQNHVYELQVEEDSKD